MLRDKRTIKVNQDDGILWIASGKIFPLPKKVNIYFLNALIKNNTICDFKIVLVHSHGIINVEDKSLSNYYKEKTLF